MPTVSLLTNNNQVSVTANGSGALGNVTLADITVSGANSAAPSAVIDVRAVGGSVLLGAISSTGAATGQGGSIALFASNGSVTTTGITAAGVSGGNLSVV